MRHGIDVSFAQGDTIDWNKVQPHVDFVYSRVSYGTNPADDDGPIFERNHDECKRLGIPFGSYFFYIAGQDGAAQAEHFLEKASGRYGTLLPMVDVEEGSGVEGWGDSLDTRIENLSLCLETITKALKCDPIIYCNLDTWNSQFGGSDAFSGHFLWVASYGRQPGNPAMPQGWNSWQLHQYTSGLVVPGISGFVDGDVTADDSLGDLLR